MRRVAELSDDIFLRRREASRGVAVGITHLSQVSCVGRGCHCFVYALNEREVAKVYFHPVTPHSALENNVHAPPLDYRNAIESTRNACLSDVVVSSAIALLGEKHTFATARCVTARLNEVHLTDVRMCEEDARGRLEVPESHTHILHVQVAARALGSLLSLRLDERARLRDVITQVRHITARLRAGGFAMLDSSPGNFLLGPNDKVVIGDTGSFCAFDGRDTIGVTFPKDAETFPPPSEKDVVWGFFALCHALLVRDHDERGAIRVPRIDAVGGMRRIRGVHRALANEKQNFVMRLASVSRSMLRLNR